MYLDISNKRNFQRPASPIPRLGADDAAVICRLLGGQTEPDASDIAQLDPILVAAYGADPAAPGAFEAAVPEHGGRPVLMVVGFSYFLSGYGPRDIPEAITNPAPARAPGGRARRS
jgi:hypothetical protein